MEDGAKAGAMVAVGDDSEDGKVKGKAREFSSFWEAADVSVAGLETEPIQHRSSGPSTSSSSSSGSEIITNARRLERDHPMAMPLPAWLWKDNPGISAEGSGGLSSALQRGTGHWQGKWVCWLCMRVFPTATALTKHAKESELHKARKK